MRNHRDSNKAQKHTMSSGHSPISYCVSSETLLVRQKFDRNMIGICVSEREYSQGLTHEIWDSLAQHMPSLSPHPRRCRLQTTWAPRSSPFHPTCDGLSASPSCTEVHHICNKRTGSSLDLDANQGQTQYARSVSKTSFLRCRGVATAVGLDRGRSTQKDLLKADMETTLCDESFSIS
jgi:hypothetical protein